jgi:iron complex outermembrane recepter protein
MTKLTRHRRHRGIVTSLFCCVTLATVWAQNQASSTSSQGDGESITLPEFTVHAVQEGAYMASESASGTRIASPIINLPYSVQVLTEDFINDFSLFEFSDQIQFVSGGAPDDPAVGSGGAARLRGFTVLAFRNGFYRTQAPDSNSIARVEVVKGPQSAVYGRVSPGGVVNYISKKPKNDFQSGVSYSLGSYDYERVDGYVTGPLIAKKVFYRIDAAHYDFQRATDFWFNRTNNVFGNLTYRISQDTSLSLEFEHTDRTMNDFQNFQRWVDATGVIQGSVFDIPNRPIAERLIRFNLSGAYRRTTRTNDSYYFTFEHRFSPDFSMRANLGMSRRSYETHAAGTAGNWDMRQNNGTGAWAANRAVNHVTIPARESGAQIDFSKRWSTTIKQRSLFTVDVFSEETKRDTWTLTGTPLDTALTGLGFTTAAQRTAWKKPDPFQPEISGRYAIPAFDSTTWSHVDGSTNNLYKDYYGSFFNHSVDLLDDRLFLTSSLRHDRARYKREQPLSADRELRETRDTAAKTTYSLGANYHIVGSKLVGYANYGTGFNPSPAVDQNTGEILGNKTSAGGEVGLKGVLQDGAFSYTLAVFRVKEENQVVDNPDNPDGVDPTLPARVNGGSTRSRGINLDLAGRVTNRLTVLGNIAWTDAVVTKNLAEPGLVGSRPDGAANAPVRSAAFALRYGFDRGFLKGLSLGGNYQYYTEYLRIGGLRNASGVTTRVDFYVPSKSQFAGLISYNFRPTRRISAALNLNVLNMFNEEKITVSAFAPNGREFRLTARLKF